MAIAHGEIETEGNLGQNQGAGRHTLWKRKTMDVPPKRRSLAKTENGQASNGWQHY